MELAVAARRWLIHGFSLPGAKNLAGLTQAPSILVQITENYPTSDAKAKSGFFTPLGMGKVILQMGTAHPQITHYTLDVSQLNWQQLPCPPAPFSYEYSPVVSESSLLVTHTGDYYLGWQTAQGDLFYNFKELRTLCIPIGGTFGAIPNQVSLVGADYDPTTGAANFIAVVTPDTEPRFVRGDTNGDSMVDLADGITVLEYLFMNKPLQPQVVHDAADANDDGEIDLADAITILVYYVDPSWPPLRAPFWHDESPKTTYGKDPTPDSLP